MIDMQASHAGVLSAVLHMAPQSVREVTSSGWQLLMQRDAVYISVTAVLQCLQCSGNVKMYFMHPSLGQCLSAFLQRTYVVDMLHLYVCLVSG